MLHKLILSKHKRTIYIDINEEQTKVQFHILKSICPALKAQYEKLNEGYFSMFVPLKATKINPYDERTVFSVSKVYDTDAFTMRIGTNGKKIHIKNNEDLYTIIDFLCTSCESLIENPATYAVIETKENK